MSPVYDSERFGFHFVASPRHADLLLVTGPVTRNMEVPLRKTYEATPAPKLVVAVGDCAHTCGVFKGSYAVAGSVDQIIPVNVFVDGCPPEPADILRGILAALGRGPRGSAVSS
jgi:Ni,Fe-hydrogenase III small subunit